MKTTSADINWDLFNKIYNDTAGTPANCRALVRLLFKFNGCTRGQLDAIEKRIARQEQLRAARQK